MKSKKFLLFILSAITLLPSCSSVSLKKSKFHYSQGKENDYTSSFYYSDEYFKDSSFDYDPSLATTSLSFAMSCFASNQNGATNDYTRRYRNGEEFLSRCGFSSIDVNSYYKEKPSSDSLGLLLGQKKIKDYTLLALGVRGGNYEQEWASNFTLGDGKEIKQAQGFYEASSIYLDSLKEYLEKYQVKGKIKIWSVGYSRGGATNNLASGRIDQMLSKGTFLTKDVTLKAEDLYAYCFEPPMGASFKEEISPKDDIYKNIHNIVNLNDPVPKVAMKLLSFTRYGVDHYLLDSMTHLSFKEDIEKVKGFYRKMDNYEELGTYMIDSFSYSSSLKQSDKESVNYTSGLFLSSLIDKLVLYGVHSLEEYVSSFQEGLRTICISLYRIGNPKSSFISIGLSLAQNILLYNNVDYLLNTIFHDPASFVAKMLLLLKNVLKEFDINIKYDTLFSCLKNLVMTLASIFASDMKFLFTLLKSDNIKAIASAHFPEICLANLMAMDKNFTSSPLTYDMDGKYYSLHLQDIDKDSKVEIYQDGKKVFSYEDSSFDSYRIVAKKEGDKIEIYLPNEDYEIKTNAKYSLFKNDQKKEDLVLSKEGEDKEFTIEKY